MRRGPTVNERRLMLLAGVKNLPELNQLLSLPPDLLAATKSESPYKWFDQQDKELLVDESVADLQKLLQHLPASLPPRLMNR